MNSPPPLPGPGLSFRVIPGDFAIARLHPGDAVPSWAFTPGLFSVTRAPGELSVVCQAAAVPAGVKMEAGWACLQIEGPFDFAQTGVLASFLNPLAAARVPIFAVSTFDTDCVLVKSADLPRAIGALEAAGHRHSG